MKYIAPGHVSSLSLRNFRGFRKTDDIPFAPLTFIVGQNSSGKSSVLDALLFLAQSDAAGIARESSPEWRGQFVDLGSFSDTVYKHRSALRIGIAFTVAGDRGFRRGRSAPKGLSRRHRFPFKVAVEVASSRFDSIGHLASVQATDVASGASFAIKRSSSSRSLLLEFSGHRMMAQSKNEFYFSQWVDEQLARIGPGNYTSTAWDRLKRGHWEPWYLLHELEKVGADRSGPKRWYQAEAKRRGFEPDNAVYDLTSPEALVANRKSRQLRAMLRQLDVASSVTSTRLSPYHTAIKALDSVTGVQSNLMDLGYGTSQVIPVLLAMMSDRQGPLLVEQPESHLHPKAQASLGELLADTSKRRQVVVETHSVHVINRARLLVAKGEVPPEHIMINFVSRSQNGTKVTPIGLDANGDFTGDWPQGFFEERYQETLELLELKTKRGQQRRGNRT